MERLTEEKQIGPFASLKDKAEAAPGAFATYDCLYAHMVAVTRLKEYEDAMPLERAQELARVEKDGRLIVLPCKPGQMVWAESPVRGRAYNFKAPDITWIIENTERFGREIFLAHEEADAALKKRGEADNAKD